MFRWIGLSVAAFLASQANAADAPLVWRHAIIEAKSDAGIFMMVTQGFAEKQGLKLEISQVKSDAIGLKALIAGELDGYDGIVGGTVLAAAHGADVKLIGCHWPGLPHGIFSKPTIASVKDLQGKTIAISTPSSLPEIIAREALAKYGVPADEVKFANMGGDLDRFKALVAGVADASVVSGEYEPVAEKEGLKLLIAGRDILPNYMRLCYFSTARAVAAHHEAAVRFMMAEMTALHYTLTHREETLKLTRDVTGIKPDDPRPAYIFDDAVKTHAVDPDLNIPVDKAQWMADQLIEDGKLPKHLDMHQMIDAGIRAEALKRLGK
ncbi:MAG: ABC transporter substrate-binding protein [Alphaproteobacteria bacterium]|nr:ABC transporter substrate-binding protein [Alphaproteobacteria bacterium]